MLYEVITRTAVSFLREEFAVDLPPEAVAEELTVWLERPLRVCGMVENHGEPGGGPFWVRDGTGRVSRQIVEAAQIDRQDPHQAAILAQATHFNPVDMACTLRDGHGRSYDLEQFVDQATAIVTTKVQNGQPIRIRNNFV